MEATKRPQFKNNGIDPKTLIGLVENTAPFLFADEFESSANTRYVEILKNAKVNPVEATDLWSYFELCLASHFATVGTFVPTDVDLAIRSKLWQTVQNDRHLGPLFENVQEFKTWDESPVSKRFVFTPSGRKLSGHQGEWFTIAMAAYAVSKKVTSEFLPEAREQIEAEVKNQELALTELKETFLASPTVEAAKAYFAGMSAVAHNLGDLDRLFDLWEIDDTDVLKRRVYRLGHADARAPKPVFLESGRIYQTMLANENHRHFALREPKCLRRSSALLLPFGPFFDDWGMNLVKDGVQTSMSVGWQW